MSSLYKRGVVALLLLGVFVVTGCQTPEALFPSKTNDTRRFVGLGALSTEPPGGLTVYNGARAHSQAMCQAGRTFHSNLGAVAPGGWKRIGENVGRANWNQADQSSWTNSTNSLWNAFMNSPGHKANILGDWTHQVVAQSICGGAIYVTHVFLSY